MSDTLSEPGGDASFRGARPSSRFFDALASERRRATLAVLRETGGAVPEERLAARVADVEEGPEADGRDVDVTLHHVHLPKLQAAGLIDRDLDGRSVAPVEDPRLGRPEIEPLLRPDSGYAPGPITSTMSLLASPRRRVLLALLERRSPMPRDALAEELAAQEFGRPTTENDVSRVRADLRHTHVHKLLETGVVETGADDRALIYRGNELLDEHGLLELLAPDA